VLFVKNEHSKEKRFIRHLEVEDCTEMPSPKKRTMKAPRLFVEARLRSNDLVTLSHEQGHYLTRVMRLRVGEKVALFNEVDGEWGASIQSSHKKNAVTCLIDEQLRPGNEDCRLLGTTLAFSPLKPSIMGFLIEKATELGVESLQPLVMERTQQKVEKQDKWRARAIEAAEQSERLSVPRVLPSVPLVEWAESYDGQIFWAHERLEGKRMPLLHTTETSFKNVAFLIGPEGGFSQEESRLLSRLENISPVSLGASILRAETACLMMLSLWRGKAIAS
jgi:16S rRNA (uracil1498-N3)-methyltransferase